MCLSHTISKNSKEFKDLPECGTYYKLVKRDGRTLYRGKMFLLKGTHIDINMTPIKDFFDNPYGPGFHAYRQKKDAEENAYLVYEKIIRVRIYKKDIVDIGYDCRALTIVAKKIRVID